MSGPGWSTRRSIVSRVERDYAPTSNDYKYPLGTVWVYNGEIYQLQSVSGTTANWIQHSSSGEVLVTDEWYTEIGSGTTGTLTAPADSTFVMDSWAEDRDAVVSTISTGTRPDIEHAREADGTVITTTFNTNGDYTLSGTPLSYPVAIIFRYEVKFKKYDRDKSLNAFELRDHVVSSGVPGGQTIIGGTGSGDNLTLESTSHATKGLVKIIGSATGADTVFQVENSAMNTFLGFFAGLAPNMANGQNFTSSMGKSASNFNRAHLSYKHASDGNILNNFNIGFFGADALFNVNASGNVGFGIQAPTSLIHGVATLDEATGDEVAYQLDYTTNKATSGDDTGLRINQTNTASPGTSLLADFQVGGVSQCNIDNAGDILNTNGVYGTISDVDLKDKIVAASPKLAELMMVNFYNYELIGGDGLKLLGPLAQELELVWPGLVTDIPHMIRAPDLEWTPAPAVIGQRQKTTIIPNVWKSKNEIKLVNGKWTEIAVPYQEDSIILMVETFNLHDEAGEIIGQHQIQIMEEYEEIPAQTEADRPWITTHDGLYIKTVKQSVFIWILCICMQELTKRVEIIEG